MKSSFTTERRTFLKAFALAVAAGVITRSDAVAAIKAYDVQTGLDMATGQDVQLCIWVDSITGKITSKVCSSDRRMRLAPLFVPQAEIFRPSLLQDQAPPRYYLDIHALKYKEIWTTNPIADRITYGPPLPELGLPADFWEALAAGTISQEIAHDFGHPAYFSKFAICRPMTFAWSGSVDTATYGLRLRIEYKLADRISIQEVLKESEKHVELPELRLPRYGSQGRGGPGFDSAEAHRRMPKAQPVSEVPADHAGSWYRRYREGLERLWLRYQRFR